MAKFEEILSDISTKVTGDDADSVKTSLKQLGVLHNDVVDKLQTFGEENKEKRGVIQNLTKQIRNVEDERDNFKTEIGDFKTNNESTQAELERLKTFEADSRKRSRALYIDKVKSIEGHTAFEKVQELLKVPEKKDDSFDWDSLEDNDLEVNYNEIQKLEKLDYFGSTPKKSTDGSLASQGTADISDQIAQANTFEELKNIQESLNS